MSTAALCVRVFAMGVGALRRVGRVLLPRGFLVVVVRCVGVLLRSTGSVRGPLEPRGGGATRCCL